MILSSPLNPAARLRGLLVLLLLTLGLLAGVSVSQSRQAESTSIAMDELVVPAIKHLHLLSTGVDELRGMAALHLLLRNERERTGLEVRLAAGRSRIDRLLVAHGTQLIDDADRQHHAAVQISLARFWIAQDRLLAASRRALADPAAAALARTLLTGESQLAFAQLRADLDAWWAHTEQRAAQATRQARAAAQTAVLLAWSSAALAGMAAVMGWVSTFAVAPGAYRARRRPPAGAAGSAAAVDGPALQQHLQALNAAVAAARRAEPGRAAGLSAQEAQRLADQVDAAASGLRALIDKPAAAPHPSADVEPH